MKILYQCPGCRSFNTDSLFGTEFAICKNCEHIDYPENFKHFAQPNSAPYKYHLTADMDKLQTKRIYAKGQYDQ